MIYAATPPPEPHRVKKGFRAVDFLLPSTEGNVSEIDLDERYPETGYALNETVNLFVYVLAGEAHLISEERRLRLEPGMTALIERGTKYFWQPLPSVSLVVFSTPAWTPEQHTHSE